MMLRAVRAREPRRMSPRTRSILAWALLALGTLILIVGSLTVWVKRQALDTDAWVDTSTQLLEDDDVREALSVYIVDQLYRNVDVEDRLEEQLPPDYGGLAAPIAGALAPAGGAGRRRFPAAATDSGSLGGHQSCRTRDVAAGARGRDPRGNLDRGRLGRCSICACSSSRSGRSSASASSSTPGYPRTRGR